MVYLTRKEHFNAAHKLYNEQWSEEKNRSVFGKCANANFHGHNYDLYITVKGDPDNNTGFVMDAHLLSRIVQEHIIEKLDHKNLNLDVDFMKGIQPSTENLVKKIWEQLSPHIQDCELHCIKLQETPTIFVEYYGD